MRKLFSKNKSPTQDNLAHRKAIQPHMSQGYPALHTARLSSLAHREAI